ncbi:MAG: DUF3995 domain-containing protein [Nocardioidaceae bacterium]
MTRGRRWLQAAAVAGGLHAAFSLYWALGGRRLLGTVGQWAVHLVDDQPVRAGLVLAVVAVVKALGAALPLVWAAGRLRPVRPWRWLFTAGAVVLVAYGSLNVVVSWGVLTGLITTPDGYDRAAQLGHAALWDPLFLLWGVCLATGLWRHGQFAERS